MAIFPSTTDTRVDSGGRLIGRLEAVAPIAVGLALVALPLLFPLGIARDYPNHLARVFIEHRLGSDPLLARNYALEWFVVPDLAMDIVALPLAGWLSPYVVGGLFNSLTLLLIFTAALALFRREGVAGSSGWPMLVIVPLFNEALRWGFMNFLFSCGMALWILYFWLESERWPWVRRLVAFSAAQLALFFAHVLGLMLCGYMILILELFRLWQGRDVPLGRRCTVFAVNMSQFAIPILLLGYVLFAQSGVGDSTTHYGGVGARAAALISPASGLNAPVMAPVLVGTVMLLYLVLREGIAVIDRKLLPVLIAMGALVVAMPYMLLGIWGLHFRYPFVALLLLIVAVRPNPHHPATKVVGAAAMTLALISLGGAAIDFQQRDHRLQEVRQAFALAESGGAILIAGQYNPECLPCGVIQVDEIYASALAAIERQMFVPTLFTATSLVAASPRRHDLDVPRGWPLTRQQLLDGRDRPLPVRGPELDLRHPYWYSWDKNFNYLLWLRSDEETLDDIPGLQRVAAGDAFILYRTRQPLRTAAP